MKSVSTPEQAALALTPQQAALGLLCTAPDIDPADIARLNALVAAFRDAHARVTDESAISEARRAERVAAVEVERLVVLLDIGRATQAEVSAAREVHANTQTALEVMPRRATAIAGELGTMRKEIQDARLALLQNFGSWEEQFAPACKQLMELAVELMFLAANASHYAGNYPFAPVDRHQLASWIESTDALGVGQGHNAVLQSTLPDVARDARRALAEAHEAANTRLPAFKDLTVPPHHLHQSTQGFHA